MRRCSLAVLALFFGSVVLAAEMPPALFVPSPSPDSPEKKLEPLTITKVAVEARIFGHIAETKMTLTFANPHPRVLAGDLYFPLPEGATVSGYALDIDGTLVDGVIVDREKAQRVFEAIVRQGIDPGILQWVKGNNFKTRVFPIPARGSRTVRVDYVADLVHTRQGTSYALPLKFKDKVGQFSVRVEVVKGVAKPEIRQGGLTNFEFGRWRDSFVAETTMQDAALTQDLIIGLPDVDTQPVLVEKGPDGEYYFCINDFPPELKAEPGPAPKRITILWDASGSRGKLDHRRELDLLKTYFGGLKDTKLAVDLVLFRNAAAKAKSFTVENGNCDALIVELAAVEYDGGTQMACISPGAGAESPNFYLLFTDGLSNFGKEEATGFRAPVYILNADSTANHGFLRHLATQTGGEYFNLNRMEDATVLASLGQPAFSFLNATAAEVSDTYPSPSLPVHGQFTLVGKLTGERAKVVLNYGFSGTGTKRAEFEVSRAKAAEGDLVRRFWAQRKVAELEILPKRNEAQIAAIGKRYGLVTSATSLIVLDRVEQYVQHRIEPPKTMPKWREQYAEMVERVKAREKLTEDERLNQVLAMWRQRLAWWGMDFKAPKDFRVGPTPGPGGPPIVAGGDDAGRPTGVWKGEPKVATRASAAKRADHAQVKEAIEAAPAAETPAPSVAPPPSAAKPAAPAEALAELNRPQRGGQKSGAAADREPGNAPAKTEGGPALTTPVPEPGVAIKPWDPQTPYLTALRGAPGDQLFATYMAQRKSFGESPAFFLDCADFFFKQKLDELATQVLSNVAELELDNAGFLRILGHRLAQLDLLDLSARVFEEVLRLRPEEPQSCRDLALVLARQGNFERAIELLWRVVTQQWDRFQEIEVVALMELNDLIPRAKAAGVTRIPVDPRFIQPVDVDLRIVLTWDADLTDMDLWVTEPSGERVFYGHNRSRIGGMISRDFTQGYGPEEYLVRKAIPGMYRVEANYFGSRQVTLAGTVTLQVEVFTNFGRPNERRRSLTFRLAGRQQTVHVGDIEF